MKFWISLLLSTSIMTVAVSIGLCLNPNYNLGALSSDDRREYNFLSNSLRDFEQPTAANALLREIECSEWPKKVERYLKISRNDVAEKVSRYVEYCKGVR